MTAPPPQPPGVDRSRMDRSGVGRNLVGRSRSARGATGRWWPRVRVVAGLAVLTVVLWRLGAGPFLAGVAAIDAPAVAAALAIGAVTTVCSAWRWRVIAGRLGVGLPLRTAVAAYYGSQLLNATLPGGVLGDVHRAVRHGRASAAPARGVRSVAWERAAGPVVHLTLTGVLLVVLPLPWSGPDPVAAGPGGGAAAGIAASPGPATGVLAGSVVALAAGLVVLVLARRAREPGTTPAGGPLAAVSRAIAVVGADLRVAVLARSVWPQVLTASVVVVLGHALTFVLAVRITGGTAPAAHLWPVAMVVLAAMLVPLNVGGWGPREGVAAGLFAAAGWGAAQGVAAATAFGVLSLIATLPGLVVLLAGPLRRTVARAVGRRAAGAVHPVG